MTPDKPETVMVTCVVNKVLFDQFNDAIRELSQVTGSGWNPQMAINGGLSCNLEEGMSVAIQRMKRATQRVRTAANAMTADLGLKSIDIPMVTPDPAGAPIRSPQ